MTGGGHGLRYPIDLLVRRKQSVRRDGRVDHGVADQEAGGAVSRGRRMEVDGGTVSIGDTTWRR